jgi:hypothetical protein
VQQLHEYGNKDRPDRHMDRSDVMQFKSSSTKTRVPCSLPIRCPFAAHPNGQMDRLDMLHVRTANSTVQTAHVKSQFPHVI